MNVLAIQDLSEVSGGGLILVHLQQLRTVVSWIRQATLRLHPTIWFFDLNFSDLITFYVTRFHNFFYCCT